MPEKKLTSYDPEYFEPLSKAEERHFWFQSRNHLILSIIEGLHLNLPRDYRILEIGCGNGNVLMGLEREIKPAHLLGMDLYIQGLKQAKRRLACPLVQADLHFPPFGIRMDLIGMFDVLEHLDQDVEVLQQTKDLLAEGGYILLTVPAFQSLWSYFDIAGHHIRRYSRKDLVDKLELIGMDVVFASYFMSSLFPIVWLRRKMTADRMQIDTDDSHLYERTVGELQIVPVANSMLKWILMGENFLINHGFRFPFGTSLVLLARKPVED